MKCKRERFLFNKNNIDILLEVEIANHFLKSKKERERRDIRIKEKYIIFIFNSMVFL